MTLLDLCDVEPAPGEAPTGPDFTAAVARHFQAHPQQWINGHALMAIGGTFAFRTRISEARRRYRMTIENRWRVERASDGRAYRVTEYRYLPGITEQTSRIDTSTRRC
jgi:hypothetical protein